MTSWPMRKSQHKPDDTTRKSGIFNSVFKAQDKSNAGNMFLRKSYSGRSSSSEKAVSKTSTVSRNSGAARLSLIFKTLQGGAASGDEASGEIEGPRFGKLPQTLSSNKNVSPGGAGPAPSSRNFGEDDALEGFTALVAPKMLGFQDMQEVREVYKNEDELAKTVMCLLEQKLHNRNLQEELPAELMKNKLFGSLVDGLEDDYFLDCGGGNAQLTLIACLFLGCVGAYNLAEEAAGGDMIAISAFRYANLFLNGIAYWVVFSWRRRDSELAKWRLTWMGRLLCLMIAQLVIWLCLTQRRFEMLSFKMGIGNLNPDSTGDSVDEESEGLFAVALIIYTFSTWLQCDLKFLFGVTQLAPMYYLLTCMWLGSELDMGLVVQRAFLLWVAGGVAWVSARRNAIWMRKSFLDVRLSQANSRLNMYEIGEMKHNIQIAHSRNAALNDAMYSVLQTHQQKDALDRLRKEMENSQMKRMIILEHNRLVRQYVSLSRGCKELSGHNPQDDVEKIEQGFKELTSMAEKESRRLAEVMGESYDVLAQLPDWQDVRRVPSFDRSSIAPEKIHQVSGCVWWDGYDKRDKSQPTPEYKKFLDERVGLQQDQIQWYAQRAEWARAPFIKALSSAVRKFNKASYATDLDLDPEDVMMRYNRDHPDAPLDQSPFHPDSTLHSKDFELSKALKGECLVYGIHAALQVGPNKDRARASAKVLELNERGSEEADKYPSKYKEKYICDWLRARVVFAHPMPLVHFFWFLVDSKDTTKLEVLTSKNKLMKRPSEDTSVSIQLNVGINVHGEMHVAEVQLILEQFLCAKDLEHKYYEYRRALKLYELLAPVFPVSEVANAINEEKKQQANGKTSVSSQKSATECSDLDVENVNDSSRSVPSVLGRSFSTGSTEEPEDVLMDVEAQHSVPGFVDNGCNDARPTSALSLV